jgi:hypothetical protein
MKNDYKIGRAITDKHIKIVKKITKDMVISIYTNHNYYVDRDLLDSVIKISSIRKYKHEKTQWSDNKELYTYEIDVIVDMRSEQNWKNNNYCQRNATRYNRYYRTSIYNSVLEYLKYFGIDKSDNLTISKIQYKRNCLIKKKVLHLYK